MASHIDKLILKLARATQGGCDLDADFYEAMGFRVIRTPAHPGGIAWKWFDRTTSRWVCLQPYTTSVEDIARRIPKDFVWAVTNDGLCVWKRKGGERLTLDDSAGRFSNQNGCKAKTPVLALCIMALNILDGRSLT